MQRFIPQSCRLLLLGTLVGAAASAASAADIQVAVSTKDTYVGMPILLQIQVSNASTVEPPAIPPVDGLAIRSRGTPSRSTHVVSINGRTTTTTSQTYLYEIVPQRAGSFRVGPITVKADGQQQQTQAIEFVASKSETGDLMFVEVAGNEQEIYVGQALDLKLRIWLRPFRDAERNITLSSADMWQLISGESSWGAFSDEMQQMADNRESPSAQEVLRKDRDGVEHSYYLYEIDATIYPKRPGKIDADDIHLIVQYPTALGRARDPFASIFDDMSLPRGFGGMFGNDPFPSPFGRRLTIQSVRPIVADASIEPIDVLPIPTADRPADYRGAVGQYQIVAEAAASSVQAGDPVELLIGIFGTGPMELVQAPPLAELSELTADFKVSNEPLAGFVQGDRKVFSTAIRPRSENVAQIPAIPFTYFDPQQKEFVTVRSQPIEIDVEPADTLALDAIVGNRAAAGDGAGGESAAPSGAGALLLENHQGDSLLHSESPVSLDAKWLVFWMAAPPLVVLATWIVRCRSGVYRLAGRLGRNLRRTEAEIETAETPGGVGRALQEHLARRFALKCNSDDAASVVGALRSGGYRNLAVRCERILNGVQQMGASQFGRDAALEKLKRDALDVLSTLSQQAQNRPPKSGRRMRRSARLGRSVAGAAQKSSKAASASLLVGWLLLASEWSWAAEGSLDSAAPRIPQAASAPGSISRAEVPRVSLDVDQRKAVLAEANDLYARAQRLTGDDSADARQTFSEAAEKYQVVVDSGVTNSRLFVNLANAYLQSGQKGRAIAYYRKALRLDPALHAARVNLQYAAQSEPLQSEARGLRVASESLLGVASVANAGLNRFVRPAAIIRITIAAWLAFWLAIGLRLFRFAFPWKSVAAAAMMVTFLSAGSSALSHVERSSAVAVVASPSVALRTGDGGSFAALDGGALHEGQTVWLIRQRGDWLKVRTRSGQTGWIQPQTVVKI